MAETTRQTNGGWTRHWAWVKWLLALGLLAFVLWWHRAGIGRIAHQPLHWPSLLMGFALCGGSTVLTFVRWYLLVKAQDFEFHVRDALRLGFIGYLFNFVGPGAVGGDLVKAALIAKEQPARRATAVATVLLDRILGLLALFIIGACAAWPQWPVIRERAELQAIVALLAGGSLAGLLGLTLLMIPAVMRLRVWQWLVRLPVVGKLLGEVIADVQLYHRRRGVLVAALGLSLIGHFGTITSFYFSAQAVGGGTFVPSYLSHLFFVPAAELLGIIPLTPGGVGLLEEAMNFLYRCAGAADGTGVLTVLAYRAVTIAVALIGAGYYLTARREIAQALHSGESSGM